MRKEQFEKTIKNFDEFTSEEQEQIINNYRDINIDFDDWNEYILSDFIEEVKKQTNIDINSQDILWSVGSRRAKFGVYSKPIIKQLIRKFENKGVYDIGVPEKLGSFLNHLGGGICSQDNTQKGYASVYFEDENENKAVKKQINDIIDIIIDLCIKYHSENEKAYNDNVSDEAVKETLDINEYEFDADTLRIF